MKTDSNKIGISRVHERLLNHYREDIIISDLQAKVFLQYHNYCTLYIILETVGENQTIFKGYSWLKCHNWQDLAKKSGFRNLQKLTLMAHSITYLHLSFMIENKLLL